MMTEREQNVVEVEGKTYVHIKEAGDYIGKNKSSVWYQIKFMEEAPQEKIDELPEYPEWIKHDGKYWIKQDELDKLKKFNEEIGYGDLSLNENTQFEDYLTTAETARILDVTRQTVCRWYRWYEELSDEAKEQLPELPQRKEDSRGWKYIHKDDLKKLRDFKNKKGRGVFKKFTRELNN